MVFPIGAALLDACVLAALSRADAYGYSLTQQIKQTVDVSESTLYPVLRRLQKEGFLNTYDPVSYTHLDVYKRQGFTSAPLGRRFGEGTAPAPTF